LKSTRRSIASLASSLPVPSTVPVAVLFTFLQRHLTHGLTADAVKG
jgi:ABC-type maltose transport system permease subunit